MQTNDEITLFDYKQLSVVKDMYVDRNSIQQKVHKMNDVWMSGQADLCLDNI